MTFLAIVCIVALCAAIVYAIWITAVTIASLFTDSLPPPQQLAEGLSDAALNGHITGWAADPDAQRRRSRPVRAAAWPRPSGDPRRP